MNPATSANLVSLVHVVKRESLVIQALQANVVVMDHPENVENLALSVTKVRKGLVVLR